MLQVEIVEIKHRCQEKNIIACKTRKRRISNVKTDNEKLKFYYLKSTIMKCNQQKYVKRTTLTNQVIQYKANLLTNSNIDLWIRKRHIILEKQYITLSVTMKL